MAGASRGQTGGHQLRGNSHDQSNMAVYEMETSALHHQAVEVQAGYRPRAVVYHRRSLARRIGGEAGDDPLPREAKMFATIAEQLETPVAVLLQVPFQPIFEGKVEDEIISYTFQEYIKSGDPTWPLLLPMVKSAVRGMDTVQSFLKDRWELDIESFTVSGASKRGWTTWLTGAVDSRAKAIAPMVIDVLNMAPQMEHQKFSWGNYSAEIDDYSEKGIQEMMATEAGVNLRKIVDPFSYRKDLKQPKLIMLGTNDAYWPVDALNLYWSDLEGEKYVLYVPNTGHGLDDYGRVIGTINGFHRCARGLESMPEMDWHFDTTTQGLKLTLKCGERPDSVALWRANAKTRDFREVKWKSQRLASTGEQQFEIEIDCPEEGYCSFFLEATFDRGGLPMFLSTNLRVLGVDGESKPDVRKSAADD